MSRFSLEHRAARALAVGLLAAWLVSSQPATGQKRPSKSDREKAAQSEVLLMERDRERLHPGDPLRISGIEQNGNDIRSRTPALDRGDRPPTLLDPEEQHRRALAIYGERASFTTPAMPRQEAPGSMPAGGSPDQGGEASRAAPHRVWSEVVILALCTLLGGCLLMRRRSPSPSARARSI